MHIYISKRMILFLVLAFVVFPVAWVTLLGPALFILLSGANH